MASEAVGAGSIPAGTTRRKTAGNPGGLNQSLGDETILNFGAAPFLLFCLMLGAA